MANIYLGQVGIEALLPPVRWVNGGSPNIPIDYSKQIDKATMLDGSTRFNFRAHHPRTWQLEWEAIADSELGDLITLNEVLETLRFQNNWEDATWRCVIITKFSYSANVRLSCPNHTLWDVSMTLEEVV